MPLSLNIDDEKGFKTVDLTKYDGPKKAYQYPFCILLKTASPTNIERIITATFKVSQESLPHIDAKIY